MAEEPTPKPPEPHMLVYPDRVVLDDGSGTETTFFQGPMSQDAKNRYAKIQQALEGGWLDRTAAPALSPGSVTTNLPPDFRSILESLADGITAQTGRAMVVIALLQMAVKAIEPQQSVRLTKGSTSQKDFSWTEGISMRSLSADYLVPFLRRHNLVLMNDDGPFMTRSFAENYPYSRVYKADLHGPRGSWDWVTDALEVGLLDATEAFVYLCALLSNRSKAFEEAAKETEQALSSYLRTKPTFDGVCALIGRHVRNSMNGARMLEVALHSLYQALYWRKGGERELRPLSQMRSANAKAGNVGDVELARAGGGPTIVAWDAKLGIAELTNQLDQLAQKLIPSPTVERAGFVLDVSPTIDPLTVANVAKAQRVTGAVVTAKVFEEWAREEVGLTGRLPDDVAADWITAYVESLCQRRREIAPIDEPSMPWVEGLKKILAAATP